ncbi:hypothetical protein BDV96DRAFT_152913 [Lophiotrema nucula]|uniref:Secreted protein n=1 Tax=Lophiotrema nucula TaxID=690887 RepID=A0A6A5Z2M5_9PLEO|nr:hypothetical protein BDV96DRAFT_152913 [Lophiotrema nucula]
MGVGRLALAFRWMAALITHLWDTDTPSLGYRHTIFGYGYHQHRHQHRVWVRVRWQFLLPSTHQRGPTGTIMRFLFERGYLMFRAMSNRRYARENVPFSI